MLTISAKTRKTLGKKTKILRKNGILPGVLYGPKIENPFSLEINLKDFEKIFKEAGESSLLSLELDGKKMAVLIHDTEKDPLTGKFIHADFYQPDLAKETETKVPLIFYGEALAVKDQGGTLVKSISEVHVKARPEDLPKEIRVNIEKLKTFEDSILIRDLKLPSGVKILKNPKDIIAFAARPERPEEALKKPIEEKAAEAEKVETKNV